MLQVILVKEIVKIESWQLLIVVILLSNTTELYLLSFIIQLRVQMFKQGAFSRKWTLASSNKFYGKLWNGSCLNTGKHFSEEVLCQSQKKEYY